MMESNSMTKIVFIVCTLLFCTNGVSNALKRPKDISEEMFCLGCQVTVKELDFMLSRKPTRGMGETVTRALKRVCDIHNFDKYDTDAKKVLQVCKHIKGDEGMEAVLITEYGRKHATGKQTSYLDITQMICGTVLKACHETRTLEVNEEDGGITYDPVAEDFSIKQGKKVRIPNPVQEKVVEPNHTADSATSAKPLEEKEVTVEEAGQIEENTDSHDEL
ncbi:uncharacterized protein LOC123564570 [Mercenaria mercenaria]|uniref:uncharacterized protein LOC123564570 n=1 Tax=Mercenaria mercenaria TaxID=6596 RepID=UPI00234F7292|nr:uncharacterized protein LOC123564570 [Mercenaria mercenaria]